MSFDIELKQVSGVLLADGWHHIQPGTFRIEEFRFVSGDGEFTPTPASVGFTFHKIDQITREIQIYNGPISSLLAVHSDIATEVFDDEDDTY